MDGCMYLYKEANELNFQNEGALERQVSRLDDVKYREYISVLSRVHEALKESPDSMIMVIRDNVVGNKDQVFIGRIISFIGIQAFTESEFSQISAKIDSLRQRRASLPKKLPGMMMPITVDGEPPAEEEPQLEEPAGEQEGVTEEAEEEVAEETEEAEEAEEEASEEAEEEASEEAEEEDSELEDDAPKGVTLGSSMAVSVFTISDDDKAEIKETSESVVRIAATIKEDEAINHSIYDEVGVFYDFDVSPPMINSEAYDVMYQKILQYFDNLEKKVGLIAIQKAKPAPSEEIRKEFNDFMFSIKTVDRKAIDDFKQFSKTTKLKAQEVNRLKLELYNNLPVFRLRNEDALFEGVIFYPLLFMANPSIYRIVIGKDSHHQKSLAEFDSEEDVIPQIRESAMIQLRSKWFQILDPSEENYLNSIKNTLSTPKSGVRILKSIVYAKTLESLVGKSVKAKVSWCNTCFRKIDVSYSQEVYNEDKEASGFQIPNYSVFKKDGSLITREDLETEVAEDGSTSERLFEPPDPSDYRYANLPVKTKALRSYISSYSGAKTWREIQGLINSNNSTSHEEGLHRRSAALKQLGAVYLNRREIRDIKTKCPFPSSNKACGATFSIKSKELGDSAFNLQSKYAGAKVTEEGGHKVTRHVLDTDSWAPDDDWKDEEIASSASLKTNGGYKFSKISFGCPCHIRNVDNNTSTHHFHLAIPLNGAIGYQIGEEKYYPPTRPDGLIDEDLLGEKGTSAFLVCGTPTSLSSFDRDKNSDSYIINHLQKMYDEDQGKYLRLINELIKNGVDVIDVMYMAESISVLGEESEPAIRRARVERISELLMKSAITIMREPTRVPGQKGLDPSIKEFFNQKGFLIYDLLKDMTLICPFGHKFTIEQSLSFGRSHSAVMIRHRFRDFSKLISSYGKENLKEMHNLRMFVKKNSVVRDKQLNYDDWVRQSSGDRRIRDLVLTMPNENGELEEYFLSQPSRRRDQIWRDDGSYEAIASSTRNFEGLGVKEESATKKVGEGEQGDILTTHDSVTSKAYSQAKNQQVDILEIPGTIEGDIDSKIASIGRAVKSTLRVINTWTNRIADIGMARIALEPPVDIDTHTHARRILESFEDDLIFYLDDDSQLSGESFPEEIKDIIVEALANDIGANIKLARLYLDDDPPRSLSIDILATAVGSAIDKSIHSHDDRELDYDGHFDIYYRNIAEKYLKKDKSLAKSIVTRKTGGDERKTRSYEDKSYTARILLVGMAMYLAEVLEEIDEEFFYAKGSKYIGYDIGVDLSSVERVLYAAENSIDDVVLEYNSKKIEDEVASSKLIDTAYAVLIGRVESARRFSSTPMALVKAKRFIVDRLSKVDPTAKRLGRDEVTAIFEASLPLQTLDFDYSNEPWNYVPAPSREVLIPSLEDTVRIRSQVVDRAGNVVYKEDGTPKTIVYMKNESIGYDGSKFQIGMIGPKANNPPWPPPEEGYSDGFVGVVLPFRSPLSKISAAGLNIPLVSLSMIVDVDSEPVDISFLFARGRDEEQVKRVSDIETNIHNMVLEFSRKILKVPERKREEATRLFLNNLRVLHELRENIPYRIRNKTSMMNPVSARTISGDKKEWTRPFPAIVLVDPVAAWNMVSRPHLIYPDPSYEPPTEKLKKFIIEVYGLEKIRKIASDKLRKTKYKSGESKGMPLIRGELSIDDLFTLDDEQQECLRKFGALKKGYNNEIGKYFDIVTRKIDENSGSSVQYLNKAYPDIKTEKIINREEGTVIVDRPSITDILSRVSSFTNMGLLSKDGRAATDISGKAQERLLDFIRQSTSGTNIHRAKDDVADSDVIKKISERQLELSSIIDPVGIEALYAENLMLE
jgi:hypothetical protein